MAFVALAALTGIADHAIAQAPSAALTNAPGGQAENKVFARGIVTDRTGALVVGAHVTLGSEKGEVASTMTNAAGEYTLAVPAGLYRLTVAGETFVAYVSSLELKPGQVTVDTVALTPGAVENVQVTAEMMDETTTVGVMISSVNSGPWYKRIGVRLRHPVAYTRYAFRHK